MELDLVNNMFDLRSAENIKSQVYLTHSSNDI